MECGMRQQYTLQHHSEDNLKLPHINFSCCNVYSSFILLLIKSIQQLHLQAL